MYKLDDSVFLRKENREKEEIYFAYVGKLNRMFELSTDAYRCIELCKSCNNIESMVDALSKEFSSNNKQDLEQTLTECIKDLEKINILVKI